MKRMFDKNEFLQGLKNPIVLSSWNEDVPAFTDVYLKDGLYLCRINDYSDDEVTLTLLLVDNSVASCESLMFKMCSDEEENTRINMYYDPIAHSINFWNDSETDTYPFIPYTTNDTFILYKIG